MKKLTVKEQFEVMRRTAEEYAKNSKLDYIVAMSGSAKKREMLRKMIGKYVDDYALEHQLGLLTVAEYHLRIKTACILAKSFINYITY